LKGPLTADLSGRLSSFVQQAPLERRLILAFVTASARSLPPGTRVLDAGAGDAPYRELFAHCDYTTSDWAGSVHASAAGADIIASLDHLPVQDGSFQAIVSTQVLEHVADPDRVVAEMHRVLGPGGRLFMTAPMVGELHEEPFDFYRFTNHGLRHVLGRAGFADVEVAPLSGYFTTLAQLLRQGGAAMGVPAQGELGRRAVAAGLRTVARGLPRLDALDRRRALPLGWRVRARRP